MAKLIKLLKMASLHKNCNKLSYVYLYVYKCDLIPEQMKINMQFNSTFSSTAQ